MDRGSNRGRPTDSNESVGSLLWQLHQRITYRTWAGNAVVSHLYQRWLGQKPLDQWATHGRAVSCNFLFFSIHTRSLLAGGESAAVDPAVIPKPSRVQHAKVEVSSQVFVSNVLNVDPAQKKRAATPS